MDRLARRFPFILLPVILTLTLAAQDIRFKSLSLAEGLSQCSINCIVKDEAGFMWFGTQDGLNRYDGYRFRIFKNNPEDPHSISDNYILSIDKDERGQLWIGTEDGLNHYDAFTERFTRYYHQPGDSSSLLNNQIQSLYTDPGRTGILWVGTGTGLMKMDTATRRFERVQSGPEVSHPLIGQQINAIYRAPSRPDCLWIGAERGLYAYETESNRWTLYQHHPKNPSSLSHNQVRCLYEAPSRPGILWVGTTGGLDAIDLEREVIDPAIFGAPRDSTGIRRHQVRDLLESVEQPGLLWIGTFGGGVKRLDLKAGETDRFQYQPSDPYSISDNFILCFWEDESRLLWIGTEMGGVNQYHQSTKNFELYQHLFPYDTDSLSHRIVRAVCSSPRDPRVVWVGTYGGLDRLDQKTGTITHFTHRAKDPESLSSNLVRSVLVDREERVWVGTYDGGLNRLRTDHNGFIHYRHVPDDPDGLGSDYVRSICQDPSGRLWIGTIGSGLHEFRESEDAFVRYSYDPSRPEGISSNRVYSICPDGEDYLWLGTSEGLNHFHKDTGRARVYRNDPGNTRSLGNNLVMCITRDRSGRLWVGTWGGGLNLFHPRSGSFTRYTKKDGLANDVVYGILEDGQGNLWVSTNYGISRFDPASGSFKNFDVTDGLQSNEFNSGAYHRGRDGKMYFGGINGLTAFYPDRIRENTHVPPVVLTDFKVANQEITIDPEGEPAALLSRSIIYTDAVRLSHRQNLITLEFASLNFLSPEKNQYAYRLEGLEKQWNRVGNRRYVTYSNLSPGRYIFRVRGSNNDGIWNRRGTTLQITIQPPFWATWWFRLMGILLLVGLVYGILTLRTRTLTRRKRVLEQLVRERTRMLTRQNQELERLSIVVRETDNGVVIMDHGANIQWINEGFVRMFGYNYRQLLREKGKNFRDFSSREDIKFLIDECLENRKTVTAEMESMTRSGEKKWIQVTLTPVISDKNRIRQLIAIASDITDLKKAHEQAKRDRLAAQKANLAKSDFLARMSHEIRTPMNGVIGFTEMLMQTPLNREQKDYLKTITRSGEALLRLINDILDFSKIEAGKMSLEIMDFDPELMAYDVCDIIAPRAENKNIEVICNVGDTVPDFIRSDPGRFRQVLINLMGNAVKFTRKGEVELSIEVDEETVRRLRLHIRVRDTGRGIREDQINRIFDVFTQADGSSDPDYGGSGLGLAICKQIARRMKGDIRVESRPGTGSTFHFTAWVDKSPRRVGTVPRGPSLKGKKALVLDDNLKNLGLIAHILKRQKMRVREISDAREAVEALQKMYQEEGCDICIIDILMPGCDGYQVARRIRELPTSLSQIPLLALSSSINSQLKTYKDAGFNGFLPKPVQRRKLIEMVRKLVSGRKGEGDEKIQTQYSVVEERKHSIHILVAEDNPINQKLARHLLTKAGYRVSLVDNGADACDRVKKNPTRYDLILMDVQMPGMDGLQAAAKIREAGLTKLPIIAITAESMKGDREKCLQAGMNDYISKPIKREKVFKLIKKWCLK